MLTCPACGEENPPRFRLCGLCGAALREQAPVEVRKTVTILFSDLAGSTALGERLDPESMRELMGRYFTMMQTAVERHGGTVEKFIGDAVMAVFGLPQAHEDDALRAVRAALDMRAGLDALNVDLARDYGVTIANRTGVNTGEVVANESAGNQRLATGDAVNVAARLEQAAPEMATLLGALTHALVRGAVEAEPVEPLELKGKAERVPAFRLIGLATDDRPVFSPFVGRDADLRQLRGELEAAVASESARIVTVIGEAGVGKSRLLRELARSLDDATVVRGRCLPYGEGITFWPLAEAVRTAAGITEDDPPERARGLVTELAGGDAEVGERIASSIGLSTSVHTIEETFWGVRRLFETLAADRPLVAVVDDTHWAERTLLDLLEYLAESMRRPCLIVCTARPEVLDDAGACAAGPRILLERLPAGAARSMAERLVAGRAVEPATLERIVAVSDGNPLFVEQMAAMLEEAPAGVETDVPPTILALLSARIDRLAHEERAVLEPAAVVGLVFPSAGVAELVPEHDRPGVPQRLAEVERRRFIRRHAPVMGGENAYQFEHILVRDAVYQRLLKRTRAQLHERFVAWADAVNGERAPEYVEVTAYHLEQAHGYLAELGPLDDHGRDLARRAGERLAVAGQRAFARGDMAAAAALLRRTVELMPALDGNRLALLPDLAEALMDVGEFAESESVCREAISAAAALGDERLDAEARLGLLLVQLHGSEDGWGPRALPEAERAIRVFRPADDQLGLAKAWRIIGSVHATALRYGAATEAVEQAIACARRAGATLNERRSMGAFTIACVHGPLPVSEAIDRCAEVERQSGGDHRTRGLAISGVAQLEAMRGDFQRARQLHTRARSVLSEVGGSVLAASTALEASMVELLAGDPAAAERELVRDGKILEAMGERYLLSTMDAIRAQALLAQGRVGDAEAVCTKAEKESADDDIETLVLVHGVRAELDLLAGRLDRAAACVELAARLLDGAEAPNIVADAAVIAARVASARGDRAAAEHELAHALALYRAKGNTVSEQRAARLRAGFGFGSVNA
jgi:class 3 adenylate cyclase/tetratricopeptide (TPR) repeat protein